MQTNKLIKLKNKIALILMVFCAFLTLLGAQAKNISANAERVYLGGFPAGFVINTEGAEVVGLCDVFTGNEIVSPAKKAGVGVGDLVIGLNGKDVKNAQDIEKALEKFSGELTNISIIRDGRRSDLVISPAKDTASGKYKIGLFIRDTMTGIGTVTYVKQTSGRFGALGHPVLNSNGDLMGIDSSDVFLCSIIGVNKGQKGRPGELKGLFIKDTRIGTAEKNADVGLFGHMNELDILNKDRLIEVNAGGAKPGKASIYTTVAGSQPKEYSINIVKVDKSDRQNKHLVIKITDGELLKETGGILQGMSGSPIIQNGKLVGAVTHVFINDPTRGFGILIDNMINE